MVWIRRLKCQWWYFSCSGSYEGAIREITNSLQRIRTLANPVDLEWSMVLTTGAHCKRNNSIKKQKWAVWLPLLSLVRQKPAGRRLFSKIPGECKC
jgi:hypothetical protein